MSSLIVRPAIVLVAALAVAANAPAAYGASWRQVTGIGGVEAKNTDEIGLERTADGVLHVAWTRDQGGTETLLHSALAVNGKSVTGPHLIYATPSSLNNSADLVAAPGGGLRVFFASLADGQPHDGVMATSTAPASGQPWTAVSPASNNGLPTSSPVYAASGIGAAVATGVPISIWGDSSPSGAGFHAGIDPATPDVLLGADCCQVTPNLAVDGVSGAVVAAWSQLGPPDGLQVLPIAPGGPVQTAPGSAAVGTDQRVGVSGRIGAGGIYAAYGSGTNPFDAKPALWRLGAKKAKKVRGHRDARHTFLAPSPGGRLWMAWDRDERIFALRTNANAGKFGAVVSTKPPKGTATIYRLNGEASQGRLDILALVDRPQGLGYWHARLLPGLALAANPGKVEPGEKIKLTVTDAGDPIEGASVLLKLKDKADPSGVTNAKGQAQLKVPKGTKAGRYIASASKPGYAKAKRKGKVVKPKGKKGN